MRAQLSNPKPSESGEGELEEHVAVEHPATAELVERFEIAGEREGWEQRGALFR